MTHEFILQILAMLGACAVTYGAIRADLAQLRERADNAHDSANKAHARIDQMMQGHQQ